MSESKLLDFTGNHAENPTLNLPCRSVFNAGQKQVQGWIGKTILLFFGDLKLFAVFGPFEEVEAEIVEIHKNFWKKQ
jgi:hypothetical protein